MFSFRNSKKSVRQSAQSVNVSDSLNRVSVQQLTSYVNSLKTASVQYNQDVRLGRVDGEEINLHIFERVIGMVMAGKLSSFDEVDAVANNLADGWYFGGTSRLPAEERGYIVR